jgi:hypothetical protein
LIHRAASLSSLSPILAPVLLLVFSPAPLPAQEAASSTLVPLAVAPSDVVPAPRVEAVTPTGYRVRVPVGEPRVTRARVQGFDLAEVEIPGGSLGGTPGVPQLPSRTILLRIPWGVLPAVRASAAGARSLGTIDPVPFARMLTEQAAARRVAAGELAAALASAAYRAVGARGARGSPGSGGGMIAAAVPMAAGRERLLAVTIRPVSWDPATRAASAAEEVTLDVSWDRSADPEPSAASNTARGGPASLLPGDVVGPTYAPLPRRARRAAPLRAGRASSAVGPLRLDPARPWLRLGVVRPGLYRVTPADLAAAGIATTGIDPATFRLFRATPGDLPESVDVDLGPDSLRECALVVAGETDGTFDPADRIWFYATGSTGFEHDLRRGGSVNYEESQRNDEESLWLTWGPGPIASSPLRMTTRDASPVTAGAPLLTSVTHRVHFEENRFKALDLARPGLRWERWFMRLLTQRTRSAFPLALPGALPGGAGSLLVRMWGAGASQGQIPDHIARVKWNGALVDTAGWNFSTPRDIAGAGFAVGTRDTLEIEVPFIADPGDTNRSDVSYLAWFEVAYPRALAAVNDTLQFAAPDSATPGRVHYAIAAVADTGSAWLLDRTDPERPVRLAGGAWSGVAPAFTLTAEESAGTWERRRYTLVSTARAAAPRTIVRYAPPSGPRTLGDLLDPGNAADYLIVAPPTFLAAAESLAARRQVRLEGFPSPRAAIATTDRIFAQFGAGLPDPVAIRNLLVYAARTWSAAPAYLCLLGDASEDPKNHSGFGVLDWVPAYANFFDPDLRLQFISDDWYAFLDGPGDQLFDFAVGRLPARDPLDALALVTGKGRAFEDATEFDVWRTRALLSADDAWKWFIQDQRDPLGNDHVRQMERKDRLHLPFPARREKVYLNDFAFADSSKTSKPKAREAFLAAVNRGNWLVDFVGHGNENVMADEQLFRAADAGQLINAARPSIFAFMSCTVGRFDAIQGDGLGELLLRIPAGGAAISLAASQEVFGFESSRLNDSFIDELFPAAPRADTLRSAGLAWALAKNGSANVNSVARKYGFLGDPAIRPPLPRGRGAWEKAPLDSLLRGEVVTLRGHALNPDGSQDTLSTGMAEIEVLGPRSARVQLASPLGVPEATTYFLPGPALFRGSVAIDRGAFVTRFVVPTDGRVIGSSGELRALLSAAGGLGVGLAADSIRIAQALSTRTDQTPPAISLLYSAGGDSALKPGDRVTIVLEDSSGIDLTRLDNAHSIFVIVDDRGVPTELTGGFRYDAGSYTRGTVELTIPSLPEGAHRFEVHASDTYRNIGVATFILDVAIPAGASAALTMDQVFNYPNPFPRETFLHARLNRPARLRVQILTVAGRKVREIRVEGKAGENYIPWDGRDSRGENVSIGVYLFRITAEAPGGSRVTVVGRALRTG